MELRLILVWIQDWEPGEESWPGCAIHYIGKVFLKRNGSLQGISLWRSFWGSRTHINGLVVKYTFFFFWLCPQHAQVPGSGIQPAPQQWQHWILNLLHHNGPWKGRYLCSSRMPARELCKRPGESREGKAFSPNSSGRTRQMSSKGEGGWTPQTTARSLCKGSSPGEGILTSQRLSSTSLKSELTWVCCLCVSRFCM